MKRFAFTLVELLIVVIIIAILAAIAIPRVMNANQRSTESAARLQLKLLRGALQRFSDDTGMWPQTLDDMAGINAPAQAWNGAGMLKPLDATTYRGPYVNAPCIPDCLKGWIQYGWVSPSGKAQIWCPQSGTALDGTPYSSW